MANGKILIEAHSLINNERQQEYGDPQSCFRAIAKMWSIFLKQDVTPAEVAICQTLVKIAREAHGHKQDNLIDGAAYIALAADLVTLRPEDTPDAVIDSGEEEGLLVGKLSPVSWIPTPEGAKS